MSYINVQYLFRNPLSKFLFLFCIIGNKSDTVGPNVVNKVIIWNIVFRSFPVTGRDVILIFALVLHIQAPILYRWSHHSSKWLKSRKNSTWSTLIAKGTFRLPKKSFIFCNWLQQTISFPQWKRNCPLNNHQQIKYILVLMLFLLQ